MFQNIARDFEEDKKNQNEEERHWEKTELTEITIYKRGNKYHESIETTVINNETKLIYCCF